MPKPEKTECGRVPTSLLDQIKDHVDRLHEIANPKVRKAAARDLIEYIQLHHEV